MKNKILAVLALTLLPTIAGAVPNSIHNQTLKSAPISADETFLYDSVAGTTKRTTLAPFLVGDCTGFPCLDGTSDGGNIIKLWAGTGSYWTALQGGAPAANRSWRLPIAAAPVAGAQQIMVMDEYGQMGFMALPSTSGYMISSTDAGVLSWAAGGSGGGYTNMTQFVDQTAWRVFYSNTAGDVTELALGADGTYLKSNGASAAPSWASPSGTMDWPSAAGIAVYGGSSAWGTSLTLDTDISSVSASDDSIPSAKAVKAALDLLPGVECGTGINCTTADGTTTIAGKGTVTITAIKSANYTIGTDSASEAYGGTFYVVGAHTLTAPPVGEGKSFAAVADGDDVINLDMNAADKMKLDGTLLSDGDKATSSGKTGDTIVCQYYSADGYYCWSSTVLGGHWTDGN